MNTLPNPAQTRTYPLPAPADDRRFTLGLIFEIIKILAGHGYPPITSGGDLVALQQVLYRFLYRSPLDEPAAEIRERGTDFGAAEPAQPEPTHNGQINDSSCPPECRQNWQRASDAVEHVDHCPRRINDTIDVADGHVVHTCCGALDDQPHRNFCEHYSPADDLPAAQVAPNVRTEAKGLSQVEAHRDGFRYQPDAGGNYAEGYADGYVDCARAATEHLRPSGTLEESRDRLVEHCLSALITVGMITKDTADALVSLWARRDRLTPVELEAIQDAVRTSSCA